MNDIRKTIINDITFYWSLMNTQPLSLMIPKSIISEPSTFVLYLHNKTKAIGTIWLFPSLPMAANNSHLHNPFIKHQYKPVTFLQPTKNPFLHPSKPIYILQKSSQNKTMASPQLLHEF